MNAGLTAVPSSRANSRGVRPGRRLREGDAPGSVSLRSGRCADAPAIHALIEANLAEGHLLPRSRADLECHATRFLVAVDNQGSQGDTGRIVGCAELAPLSASVAEVRSLVVDRSARAGGIGRRLVAELLRRASRAGFDRLCAFTHDPGYFVRKGFSIVPHEWIPEKIAADCIGCALFRTCGQRAVMLSLDT